MIVTHLVLKNWRNFRQVDATLGDRVFVIGPNASGKSNLLDAFRFLRDIAKPGGGLQKAIEDRGGLSRIRCLAARRYPDVEVQVTLADSTDKEPSWQYGIGIAQESRGYRHVKLSFEKVWRNGQLIVNRPDSGDRQDSLRLTQTHLEQIGANAQFRDIAKFFESTQYLHLVPQLIKHPEAFAGAGIPGDPFGQSFLERVSKTQDRTRAARLRKIEKALQVAVPQLKGLAYTKDEMGVPHLEVIYDHWRPYGAKQREDQFSDGTLRLLGLFWSLLDGESLLLLEEPELSLNAGIVEKLPSIIHRLQKQRKRQVIVSTHSADLLSDKGIGGEEVLILTPNQEGTAVELASKNKEVRGLLEAGLSVRDAALPKVVPTGIQQLELFR